MLKLNLPGPVIVFDTETGGLNPDIEVSWSVDPKKYVLGESIQGNLTKLASPILEIGAVVLNPLNLKEEEEFHRICGKSEEETFKDFMSRCSDKALEVNGFANRLEDLEKALPLKKALEDFVKWIRKAEDRFGGRAIASGQNVRFDIEMVNFACKRLGVDYQLQSHPLELTSYSQLYFALPNTPTVANYKLTTVASALNLSTENAHSALADVRMTAECIRRMFRKFCP